MIERLNDRDWKLISAYIDSRLSPTEITRVKARIQSEPQFKRSLDEIAYTRRLLQSLPEKRAPRNFTLSADKVKAPRKALWLQPALSFVSIAAAFLLLVVFSSSYLFTGSKAAAPAAMAPEAEMFAADQTAGEPTSPAIINWNPILGMGGGSDAAARENYTGGGGIGGAGGPGWTVVDPAVGGGTSDATPEPLTTAESVPLSTAESVLPPVVEAEPLIEAPSEKSVDGSDLSTLILGLPEEEERGSMLESQSPPSEPITRRLDSRIWIMIISGATTILAGAAVLFLRRR
jgi:hypothetical protein